MLMYSAKACQDISEATVIKELFPNIATTPRIVNIGSKLIEAKITIDSLTKNDYEKTGLIKQDLSELLKEIYNQKIAEEQAIYEPSVKILEKLQIKLNNQLIEIEEQEGRYIVPNSTSITNELKSQHILTSEYVLEFVKNPSDVIKTLVHEFYGKGPKNMEILMNFTSFLSTIDRTLISFTAIHDEIKRNIGSNLSRMFDLISILESDVFMQMNLYPKEYPDVVNLHKSIWETFILLKNDSINLMVTEMEKQRFKSNDIFGKVLNRLYQLNATFSNQIVFEAIDRVNGKISNNDILDNIYSKCCNRQKVDALEYIYEKLNNSNQLNTAVIRIGEYIANIGFYEYAPKLGPIWNALPTSVKVLFFHQSFSLKNVQFPEYVYTSSDASSKDNNRRYVLTLNLDRKKDDGLWNIKHELGSNDFYFVKKKYQNEYMYVSEYGNAFFQNVFTWRPKGKVDSGKSAWKLEIDGNILKLRNVFNNNLLCARDTSNIRYVYTVENEFSKLYPNYCK